MNDFDLVVVGAGIVGVSSALWAQERGLKTLLCDPNLPGSGASYGNACTLAIYACLPVNSPSVITGLPYLLASADSPLSINYWHAITHPRWMLSFLNNCRAPKVEHIAASLAGLLSHADAGINPLIASAGAEDLVVANDMISIWTTESGWKGSKEGTELRRRLGVDFTELSSDEILDLEPAIRLRPYRGLRFTGARHLRDPQAFVTRLYQRFLDLGGTWRQSAVERTEPRGDVVTVHLGQETLSAGRVVITAGAHSKTVKGSGAERLPLETERGYHLVYKNHGGKISRPVGWNEGGFYTTPTDGGLRLAGTVEINRIGAPMNRRRLAYIARRGAELWGPLDGPVEEWMGFRPTFPDSLPVIGPSPASDRIILAYGHQHLGLTLGGITGRIVTDLAEGRSPNLSIGAFSPARF